MTGGLQRSGRKLRLRVQLAEAETDRVIWSDRYDGNLGDLFAFQDDVTAMIAARLAVQISAAEQRRLLAENPPELRAYGLILRGQDLSMQLSEGGQPPRPAAVRARGGDRPRLRPLLCRHVAHLQSRLALSLDSGRRRRPLTKAVDLANAAIGYDSLDARGYGELGFRLAVQKAP